MTNIQNFDYSIDLLQFILWQYDKSNVSELVNQKQNYLTINSQQFWEDWYNNVFNLTTANDFGVAVWSIILDLPLLFEFTPFVIGFAFGPGRLNFTNGNFVPAPPAISRLTIEERRAILLLRYRSLTTNGTVTDINNILEFVFGDIGTSYVRDNLNMTISYVLNFEIPPWITFSFTNFNEIFPTPAAVGSNLLGADQMPTTIDFNTNWVFLPPNIILLTSNSFQTSPIIANGIGAFSAVVLADLIGKEGTLRMSIRAQSNVALSTFQIGMALSGTTLLFSGDLTFDNANVYQTFNFDITLDPTATFYIPFISTGTIANQSDITVDFYNFNELVA